MELTELEPQFIKRITNDHFQDVDNIKEADGVVFICPRCYADNNFKKRKVHRVICWQPHIPQSMHPVPGRWKFLGTGYDDLTLVSGSSSIFIQEGCQAHFYIANGKVI
jgi:hypothetical protein